MHYRTGKVVIKELIKCGFNGIWKVSCTSKSSTAECSGALLMIFNVTTIKSVREDSPRALD